MAERLRLSVLAAAAAYPWLQAFYALPRPDDPGPIREENFCYGLGRVIDGLAARVADAAALSTET